jgi:hypothetical protein
MILRRAPGLSVLLESRFHDLSLATVVSKSCAMENSVSPFLTVYVVVVTGRDCATAGVAADSVSEREPRRSARSAGCARRGSDAARAG